MDSVLEIIKNVQGQFAVGVSGGADSMCLLSLIIKAGRGKDVTVLHIEHGIRESSVTDLKLVESFCVKNDIRFISYSIDVPTEAKKNKRSIETEARLMRHKIFKDFVKENGCKILLAHNEGDNTETILMHIFRGSGISGLVGMRVYDGCIVRPLLNTPKSEIYDFVNKNGIEFSEDETNNDTNYRRNYVRLLIPEIEKFFPSVRKALFSLSKIAERTNEFMLSNLDFSLIKKDVDAILLDKKALNSPFSYYYILAALKEVGLKADFEQKHIDLILDLANLENGKSLNLPHNLRVYNEYNFLAFHFFKKTEIIEAKVSEGIFGQFNLQITKCEAKLVKGEIIVDGDKLINATIRYRKDGDKFKPCNGKSKKLKDYFNEQKIPLRVRDNLPLIVSGDEVLVVSNIQLSDKVKITDSTKIAYRIEKLESKK